MAPSRRTRVLVLHMASNSSWLCFAGFLSALVQWLFGTIILSPDQLGLFSILWSGMTLTKT